MSSPLFLSHLSGLADEHEKVQTQLRQVLSENERLQACLQHSCHGDSTLGVPRARSAPVVDAATPHSLSSPAQVGIEREQVSACTSAGWRHSFGAKKSVSNLSAQSGSSQIAFAFESGATAESEPEMLEDCIWKLKALLKVSALKNSVSTKQMLDAVRDHDNFKDLDNKEQCIQELFDTLRRWQSMDKANSSYGASSHLNLQRSVTRVDSGHHSIPISLLASAIVVPDFADSIPNSSPDVEAWIGRLRDQILADNARNIVLAAMKLSGFSQGTSSIVDSAFEILSSVVIMANVVCLGTFVKSQEQSLTKRIDMAFLSFFIFEIGFKIYRCGARVFFRGLEWSWNVFDTSVVGLGLLDLILTLSEVSQGSASAVTGLRVVRLVRLVRMVRLFRVNVFRELKLMLHGVITMMRTMCCAVLLLIFIVYFLSILLVSLLGESTNKLVTGQNLLFSTVPKAMFTVFRCMCIGDCAARDGTPIALQLSDSIGWPFTVSYCCVSIFMTYGMGSLITAMVVDSTLSAAKQGEFKLSLRRQEREKLAKQILQLTGLFEEAQKQVEFATAGKETDAETMFYMTREVFCAVCERQDVKDLFVAIDIDEHDQMDLFDALDVDGNGRLHHHELIAGLVKMRGKPRKSDAVASRLLLEALTSRMATLEATMKAHDNSVQRMRTVLAELYEGHRHSRHSVRSDARHSMSHLTLRTEPSILNL